MTTGFYDFTFYMGYHNDEMIDKCLEYETPDVDPCDFEGIHCDLDRESKTNCDDGQTIGMIESSPEHVYWHDSALYVEAGAKAEISHSWLEGEQ